MISQHTGTDPSVGRIVACLASYLLGIFLMILSDLQKYYVLKYKKGLMTTGFFKMTRNPNYLGEVFIYNSFAIITDRSEFWVILAFAYSTIYAIRMLIKDYSLSKKEGWNEYDSYFFFPKFSSCWIDNYMIYIALLVSGYALYMSGNLSNLLVNTQTTSLDQILTHLSKCVNSINVSSYM